MSNQKPVNLSVTYQQFPREWKVVRILNKLLNNFYRESNNYEPSKAFSSKKANFIKKVIDKYNKHQEICKLSKDVIFDEFDVSEILNFELFLEEYGDYFYAYYEAGFTVFNYDGIDKIKYDAFCESFDKFRSNLNISITY